MHSGAVSEQEMLEYDWKKAEAMSRREICERFIQALQTGDFATQRQILAPDFVCVEAAGLPYPGTFHGADGWEELARTVGRTWKGFSLTLREFVAEGEDNVVLLFDIAGASRRTGVAFSSSVMELWRFRDDKLAEITPFYFDTHALALADAPPH